MRLSGLLQSSVVEMKSAASVMIAASGYESRASAVAALVGDAIGRRYAMCFEEHRDLPQRRANDQTLREFGYEFVESAGNSPAAIEHLVERLLSTLAPDRRAIAIDISSMTRVWYGAFVRSLRKHRLEAPVSTYFLYVPAKFAERPREAPANEAVAPVQGFASLAPPNLPIGLLLGAGYEPERALGLQELLDPRVTAVMLPRFGPADPYFDHVMRSNADILARTSPEWVFVYPLGEPVATFRMLESICSGLERSCRVVLASLGPKLFGLECFLLASKDPQLSVWRVTSGARGEPRDQVPDLNRVTVCRAIWEGGERDS